jgi:hypothetical protein
MALQSHSHRFGSAPVALLGGIGVGFVRGKIFGHVYNDAGVGIPSVDGVPEGDYTVSTVPESYPDGYNLILRTVSGRVASLQMTPREGLTVTIPELSRSAKTTKPPIPLDHVTEIHVG